MRQVSIVYISSISPMARGCFIWANIILDAALVVNSSFTSRGSLILKCQLWRLVISLCLSLEVLE
jgi:hypothetical protein